MTIQTAQVSRLISNSTIPAFQQIKDYIRDEIQQGAWKEGDAIPSEAVLAKQFVVSRMTVNRAVRELSNEQLLIRIQGSGTFVAQQKYQATLVAIKSIAEEVRARGHVHSSALHLLEKGKPSAQLLQQFNVETGHVLFHSVIVHFENDIPIQVEDRWVNSSLAPAYLQQNFSNITPNEYLMAAAPLQEVHYRIEAVVAPAKIAEMLAIPSTLPCLVLHRETISRSQIASIATMWHPGNRYQFAGQF
ncbi:histidine utilization repressor [Solimicrobium silvestre]|uniref:Histidine utilization repressor n=1 Tax=Solimicrobium silvestre TaxID=2099400 RepID=A0A2S9GT52_9BURK|nr:histidine utilization repressor [Solimicrobium silvestre]PRC90899.1 Histidine utilization repressor [Solimicrobium silvestre]